MDVIVARSDFCKVLDSSEDSFEAASTRELMRALVVSSNVWRVLVSALEVVSSSKGLLNDFSIACTRLLNSVAIFAVVFIVSDDAFEVVSMSELMRTWVTAALH